MMNVKNYLICISAYQFLKSSSRNCDPVRTICIAHIECWVNDTVLDWHCQERWLGARVVCGASVALMLNQASGVDSDKSTVCDKSQRGFL